MVDADRAHALRLDVTHRVRHLLLRRIVRMHAGHCPALRREPRPDRDIAAPRRERERDGMSLPRGPSRHQRGTGLKIAFRHRFQLLIWIPLRLRHGSVRAGRDRRALCPRDGAARLDCGQHTPPEGLTALGAALEISCVEPHRDRARTRG